MLKLLRVDDRLLHGQVAFLWTKALAIQKIIIANDSVAHDEFMKMTLGMAKPVGVELVIEEVQKAAELLIQHKDSRQQIMAVVNNLADAQRLIEITGYIRSVNLGGLRERPGSCRITHAITLTDEDKAICRQLMENGIEVELRAVPENKKMVLDKESCE